MIGDKVLENRRRRYTPRAGLKPHTQLQPQQSRWNRVVAWLTCGTLSHTSESQSSSDSLTP